MSKPKKSTNAKSKATPNGQISFVLRRFDGGVYTGRIASTAAGRPISRAKEKSFIESFNYSTEVSEAEEKSRVLLLYKSSKNDNQTAINWFSNLHMTLPGKLVCSQSNPYLQFVPASSIAKYCQQSLETMRKQLRKLSPLSIRQGDGGELFYPVQQFNFKRSKVSIKPLFTSIIDQMRKANFDDSEILDWLCTPTTYLLTQPLNDSAQNAKQRGNYLAVLKCLKERRPSKPEEVVPFLLIEKDDVQTLSILLARFEASEIVPQKMVRIEEIVEELYSMGISELFIGGGK